MTQRKIYQEPQVNVIELSLEGSILADSVQKTLWSIGEDVTFGEEFNPWN